MGIPDLEDVKKRVKRAIKRLLDQDQLLFELDVNERSISHKLAEHLQPEFPDWDVDCEYNRMGGLPKQLKELATRGTKVSDVHGTTVFPDIIVHRRNTTENLVVIEIKKNSNPNGVDFDKLKLRAFLEELRYKYALLVIFTCPTKPQEAPAYKLQVVSQGKKRLVGHARPSHRELLS